MRPVNRSVVSNAVGDVAVLLSQWKQISLKNSKRANAVAFPSVLAQTINGGASTYAKHLSLREHKRVPTNLFAARQALIAGLDEGSQRHIGETNCR
jgi:hypothetical protein